MKIKYRKRHFKNILIALAFASIAVLSCQQKPAQVFTQEIEENIQLDSTVLGVSVITDSLLVPWELVWGPDDYIWVSEERGTLYRVNPETGDKHLILQLPIGKRPEGLQSFIVHPDQDQYPYVYLHYKKFNEDSVRFNILARFTYQNDTLVDEKILLTDTAGRGHTGSRLAFHGTDRILWATGDQAIKDHPQNLDNINGKILRMDLDGKVPDDNPFPNSLIYALGFRNMQGLTTTPDGVIYISEHGDATEDEVNLIQAGGNYGFPNIEGIVDNELERAFEKEHNTIPPLMAWTPTIAPADIDYYPRKNSQIPEWDNALLLVMLKGQGLRVLNLNDEGNEIIREEIFLEKLYGRIRALCVSPAGDIYISTSNHDWNPMTEPAEKDDRILRIARVDRATKEPLRGKTMEESTQELATGESLYQQYCFSCHKGKGEGLKDIYPPLANSAVVADGQQLIETVKNGRDTEDYDFAMPAFSFLEDEQLNKILNYVRTSFGNKLDSVNVNELKNY